QALAKPVNKAINWIVDKIVNLGKKLWAKLKGAGKNLKDKFSRKKTPEQKQRDLDLAVAAGVRAVNRYAGRPVAKAVLAPLLAAIRLRYGLSHLDAVRAGARWAVAGKINPEKEETTQALSGAELRGAVAAYRGIHFKLTWSPDTHDKMLRQNLVGKPEFSAAAKEIAGSRTPDGSDVPEPDLIAAAQLVQETVKSTKNPESVRQWWGGRKQTFDSLYLAMLQRYINTYDAFEREMRDPSTGSGRDMGFTSIPFISTSKKAEHSAAYAKGEKFIDAKDKRVTGTVGRVFVYVFSLRQLQEQDPANVQELQNGGKVKIGPRIIHEGEVTFTGYIPGENRVAQVDAEAGDSVGGVADKARAAAETHGSAEGGLREWSS
ncbi:hypothetical protein AB0J86_38750, partial [Micromonospora sp. NPDC049559]|uniref:hypothetical protein n=1 Tax=Micromonospora sp. NPDC049559 TaxID=3155923 RepID=UPI003425355D